MSRIPFIIAILVFCAGIGMSNAELYKWVDKNGVEHVSDYETDVPPDTLVETEPEIAYDPAADAKREAQDQKIMEAADNEEDQMIRETNKEDEQAAQAEKPVTPAPATVIVEEGDDVYYDEDGEDAYYDEHDALREEELHDTNRLNEPAEPADEGHPEVRYEHDMHRNNMH
jgi:hypothetical protein